MEGWERNLNHPGKVFFLKPIIPSVRSKVERPRVQRVKAHHSNIPTFRFSIHHSAFPLFQIKDVNLSQSSSCFFVTENLAIRY